ncbi:uncharacterized protein CTHT_0073300 [Thermochaetoides thermophila DSM 1495]|uniref:Yeast cell wall synthesis Kre9/Knh1-like N-terminal domain-containing protein n=1 Tax=Chaetomium thermophilum (strain DSM 1495 / CBS 144.50 / IMI 039719) TaxID=759272 RepID=G0SHT5_CHATD|nr:hypothetical protein CTHT_0073300 [Thermochaetoides thermophila DSM 1495]EGS17005.1 hypothetical protein CTHT_0073300 [Thermochaetoides thermophila DSM 1495]
MKFSLASVLALAAAAFAQIDGFHPIYTPKKDEQVVAGTTYKIVWDYNPKYEGTIAIDLLGGSSPSTLTVVDAIAAGVDGSLNEYDWEVPADFGDLATYGIMITLESDKSIFQYGFPFKIVQKGGSSSDDDEPAATTSGAVITSTTAAAATSTAVSTKLSTAANTTTFTTVTSSTLSSLRGNWSTTVASPTTVVTEAITTTASATETEETDAAQTGGAKQLAASSLALFGGLAAAILAF